MSGRDPPDGYEYPRVIAAPEREALVRHIDRLKRVILTIEAAIALCADESYFGPSTLAERIARLELIEIRKRLVDTAVELAMGSVHADV